jgi:dolichyl-phosphate-mannose--protein O-mannosyl transferase
MDNNFDRNCYASGTIPIAVRYNFNQKYLPHLYTKFFSLMINTNFMTTNSANSVNNPSPLSPDFSEWCSKQPPETFWLALRQSKYFVIGSRLGCWFYEVREPPLSLLMSLGVFLTESFKMHVSD